MPYLFEPPVVFDVPTVLPTTRGPAYDLFKWYGTRARGRSVLKENGSYVLVDYPLDTRLNSAQEAYLGGHRYIVSDETGEALQAAGFTVVPVVGGVVPPPVDPTPDPESGLYSATYAEVY